MKDGFWALLGYRFVTALKTCFTLKVIIVMLLLFAAILPFLIWLIADVIIGANMGYLWCERIGLLVMAGIYVKDLTISTFIQAAILNSLRKKFDASIEDIKLADKEGIHKEMKNIKTKEDFNGFLNRKKFVKAVASAFIESLFGKK